MANQFPQKQNSQNIYRHSCKHKSFFDSDLNRMIVTSLRTWRHIVQCIHCRKLHTIKLNKPVSMVETDHAGFQVSGWKSLIDRHNLEKKKRKINKINKNKN